MHGANGFSRPKNVKSCIRRSITEKNDSEILCDRPEEFFIVASATSMSLAKATLPWVVLLSRCVQNSPYEMDSCTMVLTQVTGVSFLRGKCQSIFDLEIIRRWQAAVSLCRGPLFGVKVDFGSVDHASAVFHLEKGILFPF